MAQDTTPAIVVYQGDGTNRVFSIPFDAGSGVINVEFILRGATQTYEYSPLTFTINDDNTALTWTGEPLQIGDFICISRSTTAQSLVMYEGDGIKEEFEIPFIRGFYGSIGVAFVYRGATQTYEYEPKTFSVDADNTLLTWTGATLNAGDYITIGRSTITGQPYELPNNQKHIEGALDNLSRQIQELKDRAVLVIDPTYRIGAPGKQNPIDWLKSIVRSKDFSVRGLRYDGKFLQFSLDNPDMPEHSKTWTSILNTVNITTVREWYDEDNKVYIPQYSMDGGATWKSLATAARTYTKEEVDNQFIVVQSGVQGNADAILKTRKDYQAADQNIRDDLNEIQTQITAQAAEIAGKQDKLIAGDNIVISGNVITATGAGGGAGFDVIIVQELPAEGQKGVIYLLAKDSEAPDIYDEYIWVTATQTFEFIGTTQVDLSDYATKEDLNTVLPDQTGNAGKFLKTDGSKASWEDVPPSVTITLKEYDE